MLAPEHVDALVQLLGKGGLLTEEGDLVPYEVGARYDRGRAAAVLRPSTTHEASAAIGYCVRHGIPVIPQSGNTGLVSGSTPDQSGTEVVLSLDRMKDTFVIDRDNRSATVSGGWRLSEINLKLQEHGLFFPIDLGADPRIGGMLATNTGGSRFLKYGDVRRNTLGLTVVLGDESGTTLVLANDLRKNNTGIDWKQIFVGTSGSFGVITECVLNLEPLPKQVATAYLVPRSDESVISILRRVEVELGSYLSAFEGMSANAITAALAHVPSLRNPFRAGGIPPYVILVEVSRSWELRQGEQSLDSVLEEVLAGLLDDKSSPMIDAFVGPPHEMWLLRHALSEGVKHSGRLIAFDLCFRRGDVMSFLAYMRTQLPVLFPEVIIADFGHIADGGVHFNLVVPSASDGASGVSFEARLRDFVLNTAVRAYGGSFSAEHAIGRKNQSYYDLYTPPRLRDLAQGLKALVSPGAVGAARFG